MSKPMDGFRRWAFTPDLADSDALELACEVAGPASLEEVQEAWAGRDLPAKLAELWADSREAELFRDVNYGQWGLRILSPLASVEALDRQMRDRPSDFMSGDVVIGEFLGDLEILVYAPSGEGERRILVALELDSRDEWYGAGSSLEEFFENYLEAQGDKFWE
ncbi:hypothetical protein [Streptomyces mirabilis]|uniref:hypothetical protein n=1 Tax=Streptomyces mirabilis TaxID=68239 RepID=UPI0036C006D9